MRYRAGAYWPGDSNVDIVAADGYNHAGCKHHHQSPMVTPGTLFDPMLHFARAHGKPAFIAEWGSQSRSGQQPAFIRSMQHFVTVNRDIAAASYFDGRNHQTPACSNIVNGHPASMAALAVMGHAPRLRGHVARR
jgi:beta-mannanase